MLQYALFQERETEMFFETAVFNSHMQKCSKPATADPDSIYITFGQCFFKQTHTRLSRSAHL